MLFRAIQSLRLGAEFTMNNDDINTIIWHTEGASTPSQTEIDAKILELEAQDAAIINARQSALVKLAALGLTPEEIATL